MYIGNIVPDEDGAVLLNFSTMAAAAYAFHAGVLIDDYTDVQDGEAMNSVLAHAIVENNSDSSLKNIRIYPIRLKMKFELI